MRRPRADPKPPPRQALLSAETHLSTTSGVSTRKFRFPAWSRSGSPGGAAVPATRFRRKRVSPRLRGFRKNVPHRVVEVHGACGRRSAPLSTVRWRSRVAANGVETASPPH